MSKPTKAKALKGWLSSLFEERSDVDKQHATIEAENQDTIDKKIKEMRLKRLDIDQKNTQNVEQLKQDMAYSFSSNVDKIQTEHAVHMGRINSSNNQLVNEYDIEQKEAYQFGLQKEFSEAFRRISTYVKQGSWSSSYLSPFIRRIHPFLHLPDNEKNFTLHIVDHTGRHEQLLFRLYRIKNSGRILGGTISRDGRFLGVYSKHAIDVYAVDTGEHLTSYSCRRLQHLRFIGNSSIMIGGHFLRYKFYRAESTSHSSNLHNLSPSTYVLQEAVLSNNVLVQTDGSRLFLDHLTSGKISGKFSIQKNTKKRLRFVRLLGSPCDDCVIVLGKTKENKLALWAVHWNFTDVLTLRWEELPFINHRTFPSELMDRNEIQISFLPTDDRSTNCSIYVFGQQKSFLIEIVEGFADFRKIPPTKIEQINQKLGGVRGCRGVVSLGDLFKGWQGLIAYDAQHNITELFPIHGEHIEPEPDDVYGPIFQTAYDGSIINLDCSKAIYQFGNETARAAFNELQTNLENHNGKLTITGFSRATVHIEIQLSEEN